MQKDDYNNMPVYCCKNCGDLEIIRDNVADYCGKCGQTIIVKTSIQAWNNWYEERHGRKFVDK